MPVTRAHRPSRRVRHGARGGLAGLLLVGAVVGAGCSGGGSSSAPTTVPTTTVPGTPEEPARSLVRATVFSEGQAQTDTYRIPSLGVTRAGTIVVTAEQRTVSARDDDPHHLVARASRDGGRTWGPIVTLARTDTARDCSPSDPLTITPTRGPTAGSILVIFRRCRTRSGLAVVRSTDEGRTWTAPAPLEIDGAGHLTAAQIAELRAGPGHGVELPGGAGGRLAFAADTYLGGSRPKVLSIIRSDDGGATWHAGATYEVPDGASAADGNPAPDETALAVAGDGTLLVSARGAAPERLQLAADPTGEQLLEVAPGQLLATTSGIDSTTVEGSVLGLGDGRIVLATLSDPDIRRGLRLYRKGDGVSWTPGPLVHAGPAAYSDLARYGARTIAVAAETGGREPYERIEVIPFPISEVDGPATKLPSRADPASYAQGRLVIDGRRHAIVSFCIAGPVMRLAGGQLDIDLSKGLGAVGVRGHLDDDGTGHPLDVIGTIPVQIDGGRLYRGPITDTAGKVHQIDLVLGYGVAC